LIFKSTEFPISQESHAKNFLNALETMTEVNEPIQQVFDAVIQEFRKGLKDDRLFDKILETKTIDDVYNATDKLQEEQAKTGHLRHLSKIEPYLENLTAYTSVIDVFIQSKDVLALIWGPIKLILQWASVLKQSFDAIIEATADIAVTLPEFKRISQIFDKSEGIKEILALFFKDILDFYLIALRFFSQPRKYFSRSSPLT
jgi:hypothetical protein